MKRLLCSVLIGLFAAYSGAFAYLLVSPVPAAITNNNAIPACADVFYYEFVHLRVVFPAFMLGSILGALVFIVAFALMTIMRPGERQPTKRVHKPS